MNKINYEMSKLIITRANREVLWNMKETKRFMKWLKSSYSSNRIAQVCGEKTSITKYVLKSTRSLVLYIK